MKKLMIGIGCVLIIVAGCIQGYMFYQQYQVRQNNLSIYNQALQLIPNSYIGTDGNLVIDHRQVKGVITNKHFRLAFGNAPLPSYHHHIIEVDNAFKKDLQALSKGEELKLQLTSGEVLYYQIIDTGLMTDHIITNAGLVICTYGQRCYFVNAKRIMVSDNVA